MGGEGGCAENARRRGEPHNGAAEKAVRSN